VPSGLNRSSYQSLSSSLRICPRISPPGQRGVVWTLA
jgi:hypothetical protein